MSIEEKYKRKNLELQGRLNDEIEKSRNGTGRKNMEQLTNILNELIAIYNQKGKQLSFPRCIVDSWDYTDKLGVNLLDLAELYKKWK